MAIPKSSSGAPVWPAGVVGSLAHDDEIAVAAVGRSSDLSSLGVDVEPDQPLPADLVETVATPRERERYSAALLASRRLFVAKEAVFKATFPLDGAWLDFHDIEVDFDRSIATVNARRVQLLHWRSTRLVTLAWVERPR